MEETAEQRRQSFFTKLLDALWLPAKEDSIHGTFAQVQSSRHLRKAPFGRGLATVVDTSVRRCWQMDASKVSFPEAPDFLSKTVHLLANEAVSALGHGGVGMRVEAHLYKLLLYEKDGQFKMHRDTEKEKGMFATMVLQLPTEVGFEGGELIVKHNGDTKTFDGSLGSSNAFSYSVFFADCQHELLKVTSGTRLCLAFNLVRHRSIGANQEFRLKEIIGS
ncbi:unnamed protein product [Calypogeia fissa]